MVILSDAAHRPVNWCLLPCAIAVAAAVFIGVTAYAQQPDFREWGESSATATAVVDVWIREAAPSGLFCSRGDRVGVVPKGAMVRVLNYIPARCGLFFRYEYLEIEVIDAPAGTPERGIVSAVNGNGSPLFHRSTRP